MPVLKSHHLLLCVLALIATSSPVEAKFASRCVSLMSFVKNEVSTVSKPKAKAWSRHAEHDAGVRKALTYLTDHSYLIAFLIENGRSPDELRKLDPIKKLELVFEALGPEITAESFIRISHLLLKYRGLPGGTPFELGSIAHLSEFLHQSSKTLALDIVAVKMLLIDLLNCLDFYLRDDLTQRKMLALKRWGSNELTWADVHDTEELDQATRRTFWFHLKGELKRHGLGETSVSLPLEVVQKALKNTLSGSKMKGKEFIFTVGGLVRDPKLYNARSYGPGDRELLFRLRSFVGMLIFEAKGLKLTPLEYHSLRKRARLYALGLLAAREFCYDKNELALDLKNDEQLNRFARFLDQKQELLSDAKVKLDAEFERIIKMLW